MKQITIYSASEYKAIANKKPLYEQWNNLSVSELLGIYSNVTRQLTFKFSSPYNESRAKRNEGFKAVLDPLLNSLEVMSDLNDQLRADVSAFYELIKKQQANDSSVSNAHIDNGVVETQQATSIDSTLVAKANRAEFLLKKLQALGIDPDAEEHDTEVEQVIEQLQAVG